MKIAEDDIGGGGRLWIGERVPHDPIARERRLQYVTVQVVFDSGKSRVV
jgi:hypothetical protein